MQNILLIGNPNTGKTTIFNNLTNSNEKVGNWNGVTNNFKVGKLKSKSIDFNVVDLPGTYSLTPLTFEEKVTTQFLFGDKKKSLIINTCEVDRIEKNLYLTLELLEYGQDMILLINNKKNSKQKIDTKSLLEKFNIDIFLIDFENKQQIQDFANFLEKRKPKQVDYKPSYLDKILNKYTNYFSNINFDFYNKSFFMTKVLERDERFTKMANLENFNELENLCNLRHQYIRSLQLFDESKINKKQNFFDKILLCKYFAIPFFLLVCFAIFYLTFFSLGKMLSDFLEYVTIDVFGKWFVNLLLQLTDKQFIISFFRDGIFSALSIILKFFPQIALLFLFLNLIEQSGYLSRVAFMFEDLFSVFGLSGKSVYTILMGFGCSVPAVMTARSVGTKNAKIKTAILTPFMSCSAKIPVYAVIGGVFFGGYNVFVIMFFYIIGLIVAFAIGFVLEKTILKSEEEDFILEFTDLTLVSFKKVLKNIWDSVKEFFSRVFVLILCTNIIIWFLSNFSFGLIFVENGKNSILQIFSEFVSPIFSPLGFSSYAQISALVCGLIAKEIVLSTLALMSSFEGGVLSQRMLDVHSVIYFSPAGAFSFLLFVLFYPACFSTMAILFKEVGKKWTIFTIGLQIMLAFLISFLGYKLFLVSQFAFFELILFLIMLVIFAILAKKMLFDKKKKCLFCRH